MHSVGDVTLISEQMHGEVRINFLDSLFPNTHNRTDKHSITQCTFPVPRIYSHYLIFSKNVLFFKGRVNLSKFNMAKVKFTLEQAMKAQRGS